MEVQRSLRSFFGPTFMQNNESRFSDATRSGTDDSTTNHTSGVSVRSQHHGNAAHPSPLRGHWGTPLVTAEPVAGTKQQPRTQLSNECQTNVVEVATEPASSGKRWTFSATKRYSFRSLMPGLYGGGAGTSTTTNVPPVPTAEERKVFEMQARAREAEQQFDTHEDVWAGGPETASRRSVAFHSQKSAGSSFVSKSHSSAAGGSSGNHSSHSHATLPRSVGTAKSGSLSGSTGGHSASLAEVKTATEVKTASAILKQVSTVSRSTSKVSNLSATPSSQATAKPGSANSNNSGKLKSFKLDPSTAASSSTGKSAGERKIPVLHKVVTRLRDPTTTPSGQSATAGAGDEVVVESPVILSPEVSYSGHGQQRSLSLRQSTTESFVSARSRASTLLNNAIGGSTGEEDGDGELVFNLDTPIDPSE